MNAQRFEDLRIWQDARELVRLVYFDFGSKSASNRDFGFCDQIQKAGVSIMNNIAEGFERHSDPEFARFLDIEKGSCGEVRSMYYVADDLQYVSTSIATERRTQTERIARGIAALIKHLRPQK